MTIAHAVFRCVPGRYLGGVERAVIELADAQAELGRDVEILAVKGEGDADFVTNSGVRVRYFPGRFIGQVVSSGALANSIRSRARALSIVHTHNSFHPLNLQVQRAATSRKIPLFVHPHVAFDRELLSSHSLKGLKKRLYFRLVERQNLDRAKGVFALSERERTDLIDLGVRAPVAVVPNGVNTFGSEHAFPRAVLREQLGIAPDAPVILYLGRLVRKKAVREIIQAVALLRAQHPAVTLLLAGHDIDDPEYATGLRALVEQEGLSRHVHFLGFVDEAGKAPLFAASDVFVHASQTEGLTLAILEAMAAGLPTVVSGGSYMQETAAAGAVLQVQQSVTAFAQGLGRLLNDAGLASRIASTGSEYVVRNHGWPALAKRVLAAYDRYSHHKADGHTSR